MRPEVAFFASIAGSHGSSLIGDSGEASVPSDTDLDHFAEAASLLDSLIQRRLLLAVGPWVWTHRTEVETLASELAAKGVLREHDLFDVVRLHPCLARFAKLYPTRPAEPHTLRRRVRGVRQVTVRAFG
jgi:hypothetical protein